MESARKQNSSQASYSYYEMILTHLWLLCLTLKPGEIFLRKLIDNSLWKKSSVHSWHSKYVKTMENWWINSNFDLAFDQKYILQAECQSRSLKYGKIFSIAEWNVNNSTGIDRQEARHFGFQFFLLWGTTILATNYWQFSRHTQILGIWIAI